MLQEACSYLLPGCPSPANSNKIGSAYKIVLAMLYLRRVKIENGSESRSNGNGHSSGCSASHTVTETIMQHYGPQHTVTPGAF